MMAEDQLDKETMEQLAAFSLRVCAPLYWHDMAVRWPKVLSGGSCFVLRFGDRLVGVTACHVLDAFLNAKAKTPTLICQFQNIAFNLAATVIDSDPELDIATFGVSESDLAQTGKIAIDCSDAWSTPKACR
jgi:hypothetical protein